MTTSQITTCTICQKTISDAEAVTCSTTCVDQKVHQFHQKCITQSTTQHKCPLCNREVTVITLPSANKSLQTQLFTEAECGNLSAINQLLKIATFSSKVLVQALDQARKPEIASRLLNTGLISDEDLSNALDSAARSGNLSVVTELLASGSISEKDQGLALVYAASKGHRAVAEPLLSSGSISKEDRGRALLHAAAYGYSEIVQLLLARGLISDEDLTSALDYATSNGHQEASRLLRASGNVS